MKKTIAIYLISILTTLLLQAQTDKTALNEHTIEVTGTAEMLVTPNEFTFKITLYERFENKEKITIDKQEAQLKEALINLGIDVQKDLTIADLNSVFMVQRRKKDVMANKDYHLKIHDVSKIEKLQQIADKLDIGKLDLINATHTELAKFRKETKMEAVKAAKLKAEYMLEAIGEKIGKTLFIQEVIDYTDYQNYQHTMQNGSLSSNSVVTMQDNLKTGETLNFSNIKLKYNILARFEIK
jgi:uncharacterized protein